MVQYQAPPGLRACCSRISEQVELLRFRLQGGFQPVPIQKASSFGLTSFVQKRSYTSRRRLLALAAVLLSTASGAVAAKAIFHPVTWVEAVYFAVTTITTVGYGDYNPAQATRHKHLVYGMFMIFHMVYIVVGVGTLGAAVALLLEAQIHNPAKHHSLGTTVAMAALASLLLLVFGASIMSWIEGWDSLKAAYWAVVTLSTVGYGHVVPQTDSGRAFAVVFMLAGISCEATLFSGIAMMPVREYRRLMEREVLRSLDGMREKDILELAAGEQLKELGIAENDTYVTRDEFCLAMLLRLEKISAQDLRECQEAFRKLEARRRGKLGLGGRTNASSSSVSSMD
uniref:Potassium channel domain-containing protein n=1 Tax=Chrysotila carterae TaxID=13221 RepID=A0A7S4B7R4_CHRCT|mmetsp:Transcript_1699/g.3446  ORF Transcript_1699/g.3446 Transcript_1699/m.3446 type:complete len:341 (-) Transcript_1699:194-1216(-)